MKVEVRESTMVRPAEETPKIRLWNSCLDLTAPNFYAPSVRFYRANGDPNFFNSSVMKEALSRALVVFYPMGGRFIKGEDGRIEIDCQGQGALFVEADCDGVVEDVADFAAKHEYMKLVQVVKDYSLGFESYPLLIVQVTYFKCGGASLGVASHHYVADGLSTMQFINAWSDLARGLGITPPLFIDRTLLRAQDPPKPVFKHVEYLPDPAVKPPLKGGPNETKSACSIFKFTRNQLNLLKSKSKEDGNAISYSSFEMLSGHIWKCVCKARGLQEDQVTKLIVPTDGRARLQPSLPPGYFGNVVFTTAVTAAAGDIQSKHTSYAASKIHDTLAMMKNDYLKSAIDYLELHLNDQKHKDSLEYANLRIVSWARLPIYEPDFGWGRPSFVVPAWMPPGYCFVLPSPLNDGSLSIIIGLEAEHMKLFSNMLYAF